VFSTWRPLNKVLEDRPLALCDSRSIDPEDLIAADRILPDRVGEVYYLRQNPRQRWSVRTSIHTMSTDIGRYWLEEQKNTEPFLFLMYDTMGNADNARCEFDPWSPCVVGMLIGTACPHVSFINPRASLKAEPRASVETRSIVITTS
jgi:hypothetical protein